MNKSLTTLVTLIIFFSTICKAQKVEEIMSFTYKISDDGVWYLIMPCLKFDNGSTKCITDSILSIDPILDQKFSFSYNIKHDWLIGTRCYKYNDLVKCNRDSILMYTPIKYFYNKKIPKIQDTLSILGYSNVLRGINEPKIYNNSIYSDCDIIRFSWFKDTSPVFYRIEKKKENISVTYKKTTGISDIDVGKIIIDTTYSITEKTFKKIVKLLENGSYWNMDNTFVILPRDILIESYINNQYYYINKNIKEIENNNIHRKILKCFIILAPQ